MSRWAVARLTSSRNARHRFAASSSFSWLLSGSQSLCDTSSTLMPAAVGATNLLIYVTIRSADSRSLSFSGVSRPRSRATRQPAIRPTCANDITLTVSSVARCTTIEAFSCFTPSTKSLIAKPSEGTVIPKATTAAATGATGDRVSATAPIEEIVARWRNTCESGSIRRQSTSS
uniref:Putative secreted protein n=1 Tax=Anopheles marajoara TaxID=58244 RepID=A0A2M4C6F9_9DIPT